MNLCLAFHEGDKAIALAWLKHTAPWDHRSHDLYLLPARGVDSSEHLACAMVSVWKTVTELPDCLAVKSNWSSDQAVRNANGPNSMFRQFARYFRAHEKGSWMFCEPDCIPLAPQWLDVIEAEYGQANKPFMGALVPEPWPHITGNMVCTQFAADMVSVALPTLDRNGIELAFDLAAAKEILPQCHVTKLIQHVHRASPFSSREDFEQRVSRQAVIFHGCKDGSIYQFINHGIKPDELTRNDSLALIKKEQMRARMAKARAARGKKKNAEAPAA